jgi:hypothetical protein
MKLKKGFRIREIADEKILVAEGLEQVNFDKVISLNSSAAFLWENLQEKDFEMKDVADLLIKEYGIDSQIANTDANSIVNKWKEIDLIER